MASSVVQPIFVRDRFTWLAYFMLAYYAFLQSALGPLMPFLRAELNLSYTIAGLHLSAFAAGMICAGLFADRLAWRWGRRSIYWGGAAGMAVGAVALTLARQPALTIASILIMGTLGSLVLVMVQAMLSDRHGGQRATALTEANVAAAASGMLAPLAVGSFQQAGLGWRWPLIIAAAILMLAALRYGRDPVPDPIQAAGSGSQGKGAKEPLPALFWIYWLVILAVVSVEWCLIFWGADFLENVVGLPKAMAATLMTIFWLAYVAGRYAGSHLTRLAPASRVLMLAFFISMTGFPLLWLAKTPWLNVVGLFIVGLGFANLFPLTMAIAVGTAPAQSNAASARLSLGGGVAILTTPLLLGGFADQVGIFDAYALVAVLLVMATAITWLANRLAARQPA